MHCLLQGDLGVITEITVLVDHLSFTVTVAMALPYFYLVMPDL